jgi:ABC-type nitrate/sulfonate/bicarbonate transport system substrate-binding protein
MVTLFFANRDWLARNVPLARRFVSVIYDTARWANANHAATLPIVAKYAKSDVERLRGATRTVYVTSLTPALIQPAIDIAVKYKALEHPIDLAAAMVAF